MPNPLQIQGYRAGETLPLNLHVPTIIDVSEAVKTGQITPEQLLSRILLEGREDAGVTGIDRNSQVSAAYVNQLKSKGFSELGAETAAVLREKIGLAKRLGVSLDEAWNGTGRSAAGLTGKDYAQRAEKFQNVAADPRNASLLNLIRQSAESTLPPERRLLKALLRNTVLPAVYGEISPQEETRTLGSYQTYDSAATGRHLPGPPLVQDYLNGIYQDLSTANPGGVEGAALSKAVGNLTTWSLQQVLTHKVKEAIGLQPQSLANEGAYKNLAPEGQAAVNRMARAILKTYGVPPPEPLPPGIGAPGTYP